MKNFNTVMKFEYTNHVRNKAFIVTTAILLVIILLAGNIPNFASLFSPKKTEPSSLLTEEISGESAGGEADEEMLPALLYDPRGAYDDETLRQYFPGLLWVRQNADTEAALQAAVESEEYSLALAVNGLSYTLVLTGSRSLFDTMEYPVREMVTAVYQQNEFMKEGISEDRYREIQDVFVEGSVITVGKDIEQSYWLGYALLMVLYMTIIMYGQYVMTSVILEKTSKTMELLITSVKPTTLMFGKVIGVGLAGLTQLTTILLAALATISLTQGAWESFAPGVAAMLRMTVSVPMLLYALLFFLLGFFVFAFLYAAFASTVSRIESSNSVAMFPMLLFMAVFFVAMFSMSSPDSTVATVFSFIPFFSPLVMFMRICVSEISPIFICIAVAIDVLTVYLVGILSARVYRAGVMMYGKPPSLLQVLKYMVRQ